MFPSARVLFAVAIALVASPMAASAQTVITQIRNVVATGGAFIDETARDDGIVSATKSLSVAGASAAGSVSLAGGVVRANASTPLPTGALEYESWLDASARSLLNETLTFDGNESFNAVVRISVFGNVTAAGVDSRASGSISATARASGQLASKTVDMYSKCPGGFDCIEAPSFDQVVELPFRIGFDRNLDLSVQLIAGAVLGGSSNFGNSAYIRIVDLPSGVSYASRSGVFLSDPVPIPGVPEPSSVLLMLLGVGLVWHMVERRKIADEIANS